jgi:hypothetical protein
VKTSGVLGWALLVCLLWAGCEDTGWPRWASDLAGQLRCGMSPQSIQSLTKARLTPLGSRGPFGTHSIHQGKETLWLLIGDKGLESILLSKPDGWKVMSTRLSPRRNLCTGQESFLLKIEWSQEFLGATVYLDGRKVDDKDWSGAYLEIPSGRHELRIEKSGLDPVVYSFDFGPEDRGDRRLDLTARTNRRNDG